MLDVKGDKSLWEKQNLEGVGKVLLVEESYYDGIVEMVEQLSEKVERLEDRENSFKEIIKLCNDFKVTPRQLADGIRRLHNK